MNTGALRGTRRPVPDDLFGGRLRGCFLLDLEVAGFSDPRPDMRAITFQSPDLFDFEWQPGQDLLLEIPVDGGSTRRRYTIRRSDPVAGTLDIEFVLHGTGPFANWAETAVVGDHIAGVGPRGVVTIRQGASHHLFVADTSAIPFTLAMIEALPQGATATAILVVDDVPSSPEAVMAEASSNVIWVKANDVVETLRSVSIPDGSAAYVNGERILVRNTVQLLIDRGIDADAIASKPYWRRDQPNAAHGEPSKD